MKAISEALVLTRIELSRIRRVHAARSTSTIDGHGAGLCIGQMI